ncbi:rRNA processing family protein [Babesia bovis T2Bo]|uniref:rRNA-processing protein FYV7 n=1 Tax=Babesia bovis TaxID=5865 RepID=A7AMI8_BABBO|nr:rRNA processing family protein [Babesia bovis T2Bo]EDO07772.1 rRNA processing family protein [Babesia bovis T2Bo]|eukprot:XP_001611340.1 hypothetical protein [Babesia bovis T2Bo]
MAKNLNFKGQGAYWKGSVKNKTIARKNKQYISDQRCLKEYKKQLRSVEQSTTSSKTDSNNSIEVAQNVTSIHQTSSSVGDHHVEIVKPQIERVYLQHDENTSSVNGQQQTTSKSEISLHKGDSKTSPRTRKRDKKHVVSVADSANGSNLDYDEPQDINSCTDTDDVELPHIDGSSSSNRNVMTPEVKSDFDATSVVDNEMDNDSQDANNLSPKEPGHGKYSGVYAKALKLREERAKLLAQQHNERVEKIKQKKREIRTKKQARYERHRLLGEKTKRGQPIMSRVITHLMKNFERKHGSIK